MGAVKGLTKSYTTQRIQELLPAVHLEPQRKKKIRTLSGGMRQRLGIAQALLNDPAVLILDEPTAGLDPKERNQFFQLLSEMSKDKIILLSTHIVSDVEAIADQIMIMKKGCLIAHDTPQKASFDAGRQGEGASGITKRAGAAAWACRYLLSACINTGNTCPLSG